jgi:hypothetical protein
MLLYEGIALDAVRVDFAAEEALEEVGYQVVNPARRDEADGFDPDRDEPKSKAY